MALHPYLSTLRRNLPAAARMMGFNARVTSAYRSPQKQAELYQRYLKGLMPYPVAPPGYSDHEKGLALDVVSTDTRKLVSLLTGAGLSWAGQGDPVHFSLKGAPRAKKASAGQAWREGPGSSIPPILTYLPFVGQAFSTARDPEGTAKENANTLFEVFLGFL